MRGFIFWLKLSVTVELEYVFVLYCERITLYLSCIVLYKLGFAFERC